MALFLCGSTEGEAFIFQRSTSSSLSKAKQIVNMINVLVAKPDDQHADLTEPPDIRHDSWVHLEVDHILKRKLNNVTYRC